MKPSRPHRVDAFAASDSAADIAAVIVTHNSADDIDRAIASLRAESADQSIRVVVVDNASSDSTVDVVARHDDVELVHSGGNIGFAAGINVAMGHIGPCEAILVLNPDAIVERGAIAALRRRLQMPGIGIVAPLIEDADRKRYDSVRREPRVTRALGDAVLGRFLRLRARPSEIVTHESAYSKPHPVDWASGAALLIDREVARIVGGWDEHFFLYSEEADFQRRARDAGFEVWFEPTAVVRHAERGSGFSLPLDKLIAVNRIRYARKHMGRARATAYRGAVATHHLLRSRGASYRAILGTVVRESTWRSLPHASWVTRPSDLVSAQRKKVVLIAPAADGEDISEAFNSFQWASHLSERHDVTVLATYKKGHVPLSAQLPSVRVVEWSDPPLVGRFERFNSLLQPGYFLFAVRARRWLIRRLAAGEQFDIALQVAPVAIRYPSPAAGLGIPMVLGPVGGGLSSPTAFVDEEGGTPWYQRLRALDAVRLRYDLWLRRTYRTADCVVGIAPYVSKLLSDVPVRAFETMSEVALLDIEPPVERRDAAGPVRLLHVGRTVRTKGLRDLVRALAKLPDISVVLDVLGEGNDRQECEDLVDELGLRDRVVFHGHVARAEVDDFYRRADVFVFPSYREPGGGVIVEALSFGLPLIVCEGGGPAAFVNEDCAIVLPVVSPAQLATDCADAIRRLVEDSELRLRMGRAARTHAAQNHLWTRRVDQMEGIWNGLARAAVAQ